MILFVLYNHLCRCSYQSHNKAQRFPGIVQAHDAKVHLEQAHWKDQVRTLSKAQEDSNDILRGFKDLMTCIAQDQREFQANLHASKEDKGLVDQTTSSFENPQDYGSRPFQALKIPAQALPLFQERRAIEDILSTPSLRVKGRCTEY